LPLPVNPRVRAIVVHSLESAYAGALAATEGRVEVIIDTDAATKWNDQWAIALALGFRSD
jgi:hypothetical protein